MLTRLSGRGCFWLLLAAAAAPGCTAKHPEQIQASPEQQKQWQDEENAASQRKLDEARAHGNIR